MIFARSVASVALAFTILTPATIAAQPFRLAIDTSVLAGLPRTTVSATDESGHTSTYGGVALRDLIARAGAPSGHALRGTAMTGFLLVGASDGYHVVIAMPEVDASFTDRVILLADTRDGAPLSADEGPLRLIVPGEKRQGRWVKHVTSVELRYAATP
jgi:hypothetical protein